MRREFYHFTPEQVEQAIVAALDMVERLDPPDDLRAAVFGHAVTMLGNKQVMHEQIAPLGQVLGRGV